MRKWLPAAAAALALALAGVPGRAWLFGRHTLVSRWTAARIAVNGDDSGWKDSSAFEEDGLSLFAMNDAESLYLLVTAHTREARDQLTGESRQDVTLWFVAPDGKTREWGARLPYSRRASLTAALRDPAGLDPEPEFVHYQGPEVSSGSLPGEIRDWFVFSVRRPIWELKIPLKRLAVSSKDSVAVDFVLNAPMARIRSSARAPESEARAGGPRHPEELVWNAQRYVLSVHLARDPSLPR